MLAQLKTFYLLPFKAIGNLIGVLVQVYYSNRQWLKTLMAKPHLANAFQCTVIITALIWLLIAAFAPRDQPNRFSETVQQLWTHTTDKPSAVKTE